MNKFVAVFAMAVAAASGARFPRDNLAAYGAAPAADSYSASASSVRTVAFQPEPVAILRSVYNTPTEYDSGYNFDFETADGTAQEATGAIKNVGGEDVIVMRGSYTYTDSNGELVEVSWTADENGYRAESSILPIAPAIPFPEQQAAVDAQLRFAAEEQAASRTAAASSVSNSYSAAPAPSRAAPSTSYAAAPAPVRAAPATTTYYAAPAPAPAPVVIAEPEVIAVRTTNSYSAAPAPAPARSVTTSYAAAPAPAPARAASTSYGAAPAPAPARAASTSYGAAPVEVRVEEVQPQYVYVSAPAPAAEAPEIIQASSRAQPSYISYLG